MLYEMLQKTLLLVAFLFLPKVLLLKMVFGLFVAEETKEFEEDKAMLVKMGLKG